MVWIWVVLGFLRLPWYGFVTFVLVDWRIGWIGGVGLVVLLVALGGLYFLTIFLLCFVVDCCCRFGFCVFVDCVVWVCVWVVLGLGFGWVGFLWVGGCNTVLLALDGWLANVLVFCDSGWVVLWVWCVLEFAGFGFGFLAGFF